MKLLLKKIILSICLIFIVIFSFFGCRKSENTKESLTGFYFDTVITVTIYETSSNYDCKELLNQCMELASYYENLLSRTVDGSDIWEINHSKGQPVTVQDETLSLLKASISYAEMSDGLVDPTIGTLSTLWNFGDTNQKNVPSKNAITEALSHVNYKTIQIEGNQVTLLDPNAYLDLGFIAKGYIADQMKAFLLANDVENAIINLGGNVLTIGSRPDGTPFQVGVQDPFSQTGTSLLILSVTDQSLVSSGNYERCFEKDGILYHHILSTKDGYPVNNDLAQVTIISKKSVDGDALSTLCFVLGYEKGKSLIESLEGIEAIFVTQEGEILKTY